MKKSLLIVAAVIALAAASATVQAGAGIKNCHPGQVCPTS